MKSLAPLLHIGDELGKTLSEVRQIPYPELQIWLEYYRQKWERLSIHEWYLMSLTAEVRSLLSKRRWSAADCRLKFLDPNSKSKSDSNEIGSREMTPEEIQKTSEEFRANFKARFGRRQKKGKR